VFIDCLHYCYDIGGGYFFSRYTTTEAMSVNKRTLHILDVTVIGMLVSVNWTGVIYVIDLKHLHSTNKVEISGLSDFTFVFVICQMIIVLCYGASSELMDISMLIVDVNEYYIT
jgi:hypothetical protein